MLKSLWNEHLEYGPIKTIYEVKNQNIEIIFENARDAYSAFVNINYELNIWEYDDIFYKIFYRIIKDNTICITIKEYNVCDYIIINEKINKNIIDMLIKHTKILCYGCRYIKYDLFVDNIKIYIHYHFNEYFLHGIIEEDINTYDEEYCYHREKVLLLYNSLYDMFKLDMNINMLSEEMNDYMNEINIKIMPGINQIFYYLREKYYESLKKEINIYFPGDLTDAILKLLH